MAPRWQARRLRYQKFRLGSRGRDLASPPESRRVNGGCRPALRLLPACGDVIIHARWICPGPAGGTTAGFCQGQDFRKEGFLQAFVVNELDQPISFNGLIGEAVLRLTPGSASAYNAVAIQSVLTSDGQTFRESG